MMSQQSTPRRSIMDEDNLDIPFHEHLAMPRDEQRRFLPAFRLSFDAAYKKNSAKRFCPSDESPTHVVKAGIAINKNKQDRQFELIQSTIFTTLDVLFTQMEQLQAQMTALSKAFTDLATSIPTLLQTQVDAVSKKLDLFDLTQFPPLEASLEKTVTAVKSAVKESIKSDSNDRLRKNQVFLRNLKPEKGDLESIKELCSKIDVTTPLKFFRLQGKEGIRPVILTFTTAEEAVNFIRNLSQKKRDGDFPFPNLVARPNYTAEEEKIFKAAWGEACALNDAAGRKEFVVRNLKMVKLDRPGEWTKKDRPART